MKCDWVYGSLEGVTLVGVKERNSNSKYIFYYIVLFYVEVSLIVNIVPRDKGEDCDR